tara:strand:+ start:3005 stop:4159 length:1155 start_codon:yes stop_codon:yes gene_type:complete
MIDILSPLIKQFLPFAKKRMGFKRPPKLFLRKDVPNAQNPLGKTAFYDPQAESITLYVTSRHPKDVMRSLSHELVHHKQNCGGQFEHAGEMGEGYAQTDDHLREMEREAYEMGNMCFRDWEDSIKGTIYFESLQKDKGAKEQMSIKDWKNGEISTLLSEAWGFKFNTLQEFDKFNGTGEVQEEAQEEEVDEGRQPRMQRQRQDLNSPTQATRATRPSPEEESEEAEDEKKKGKKKQVAEAEEDEPLEESPSHPAADREGNRATGRRVKKGNNRVEERKKGDEGFELNEDSGEEEAWHQWKNEHADDDHIKEIEHHLRALKDDRDHERHGAEYDHDKYEDEGDPGLEEALTNFTNNSAYTKTQVREALKRVIGKLKESNTNGQKK